jgi:hypothetical protein
MTAPTAELAATAPALSPVIADKPLPTFRLNLMRVGYLVMGVGLVFVKWPLFFQEGGVASMPVFEGAVAALLTAMSLLALLGLRYPIQLLPVLVFESLWKAIWFAAVAVPHLIAGDMDRQTASVLGSFAPMVIVVAVTPWGYVWKRYVRAPGDPWR